MAIGISSAINAPEDLGSSSWNSLNRFSASSVLGALTLYAWLGTRAWSCIRRSMFVSIPSNIMIGIPPMWDPGGGNVAKFTESSNILLISILARCLSVAGKPGVSSALYHCLIVAQNCASLLYPRRRISASTLVPNTICAIEFDCLSIISVTIAMFNPTWVSLFDFATSSQASLLTKLLYWPQDRGQPYVPPSLYSPGPMFPGPIFPGTYVPPS